MNIDNSNSNSNNNSIKDLILKYTKLEGAESRNLLNSILIVFKNTYCYPNNNNFESTLSLFESQINSNSDSIKKNSLKLLGLLIEKLPTLKLDFNDIHKILILCFKKLQDVITAGEAIKLIYLLLNNFTKVIIENSDKLNITKEILNNFSSSKFYIPSYSQEIRINAYKIYLGLLDRFYETTDFKAQTDFYLKTILETIDGEKDPRNLLIMFRLVTLIHNKIDSQLVKPYAKNFFGIVQDYYPIDFEPPKTGSPDTITCEDLSNALNDCFGSSDLFIEYVIELLKGKDCY